MTPVITSTSRFHFARSLIHEVYTSGVMALLHKSLAEWFALGDLGTVLWRWVSWKTFHIEQAIILVKVCPQLALSSQGQVRCFVVMCNKWPQLVSLIHCTLCNVSWYRHLGKLEVDIHPGCCNIVNFNVKINSD
jgi:hypothetical protein